MHFSMNRTVTLSLFALAALGATACGDADRATSTRSAPLGAALTGCVTDPTSTVFTTGEAASMVATNDGYGIAWWDRSTSPAGLAFARLDAGGNRIGDSVRLADGYVSGTKLVFTGSGYGLIYSLGSTGTWLARLDADGQRIGADASIAPASAYVGDNDDIVFNGSEYGVAWMDEGDPAHQRIVLSHIGTDGQKIGADLALRDSSSSAFIPAIAWTGSEYGIAWTDERDSSPRIYFARVNAGGQKIGDEIALTDLTESAGPSAIVWSGTQYGLFYVNTGNSSTDIRFSQIAADGTKAGNVTTLGDGTWTHLQTIWTGTGYALAPEQSDGVALLRIDPRGNPSAPRQLIGSGWGGIVTWNGDGYRIAWSQQGPQQVNPLMITPLLCP